MKVYRLEFLQPDGRWTGPYTAEYMTEEAFLLRDQMMVDHKIHRPYPNSQTFSKNPGPNRYVCGSPSKESLKQWFGRYLELFKVQGGHIGVYEVPIAAISEHDEWQVVYQQKQAKCISREGRPVNTSRSIERIHPDKVVS